MKQISKSVSYFSETDYKFRFTNFKFFFPEMEYVIRFRKYESDSKIRFIKFHVFFQTDFEIHFAFS